jgi:phosphomannomutase
VNERPAADLSALVKAYDVRGLVPEQLDDDLARLFGAAFVETTVPRPS